MKLAVIILSLFSLSAFAGSRIECSTGEYKILITSDSELKVTYKGETVIADGIANAEEVDLVARFKSIGEMTLFAKVGKTSPENYIFIQSKRIPVQCR
jgi:hypothetical protein